MIDKSGEFILKAIEWRFIEDKVVHLHGGSSHLKYEKFKKKELRRWILKKWVSFELGKGFFNRKRQFPHKDLRIGTKKAPLKF